MIEPTKEKLNDLPKRPRKVMLTLIREFSQHLLNNIDPENPYAEQVRILGREKFEEVFTKLIEKGSLKICYHQKEKVFDLMVYDFNKGEYKISEWGKSNE